MPTPNANHLRLRAMLPPGIAWQPIGASGDPEILRLDTLDTDLLPPSAAVSATHAALTGDMAGVYPTSDASLRTAILAHHSRTRAGADALVTPSVGDALQTALLATAGPGDEVLLLVPGSAQPRRRIRLAGATPVPVPLDIVDGRWRLDLLLLEASISRATAAIVISSPSPTTGMVLDASEWSAIADLCRMRDLWLIHDATMQSIVYDNQPVLDPATLPGMAERTLSIGSSERALRMAGWRAGWLVGPQAMIERARKTVRYEVTAADGPELIGIEAALRATDNGIAASVAEWQQRRDALLAGLAGWPVVVPDGGWNVLLDAASLGMTSQRAVQLLSSESQIDARVLDERFVRLAFAAEPVARLRTIPARLRNTTLARKAAWLSRQTAPRH
jgi:aspartate/methionine/tyrosine aminotransferase